MKLGKRNIDALAPGDRVIEAWDDELAGFGLKVHPSGRKTYVLRYRTATTRQRWVTLGTHGALNPDQARRLAQDKLAEVRRGGDPAETRTAERQAATVDELLDRARALGAETFEQPVGPGELMIAAIRGVGGGLVYFVDGVSPLSKVWVIEFTPSDAAPRPGVGLTRIDHLGQTVEQDELLSWLLYYTAIFRTEKTPQVDVVDPGGLIRSQAIESADGGFRLALNSAENRRTMAGRFITESFGSGLQHIAFATDDLFATADALAGAGFRSLPISPDYYDDIEARFGLDPAVSDRIRAANILYDRDESGEFFQLYAPAWASGFILEVVERRGRYRGYGAPNAPFRIAAQKRLLGSRRP